MRVICQTFTEMPTADVKGGSLARFVDAKRVDARRSLRQVHMDEHAVRRFHQRGVTDGMSLRILQRCLGLLTSANRRNAVTNMIPTIIAPLGFYSDLGLLRALSAKSDRYVRSCNAEAKALAAAPSTRPILSSWNTEWRLIEPR
jgi:hypothetical protein